MTKKNCFFIAVLIALAGIYVFYFTDWFQPKIIHISYTTRSTRVRARRGAAHPREIPIRFGLGRPYRLTEVKVIPAAEWQTNSSALPVWHLVSDSNSVPVNQFFYGERIRGMKPKIPGTRAEPLQSGVAYRLFLQAGSATGERDFEIKPAD